MRNPRSLCLLILLLAGTGTLFADADGTMYFTTFAGGDNVHSVDYSYVQGVGFSLFNIQNLTATNGADGILMDPNNQKLAVGGQGNNNLAEENLDGTGLVNVHVGSAGQSFHLALSSDNHSIWNMPNGGSNYISIVPLNPFQNGTSYQVVGDTTDVRGVVWNPVANKYFYSSAEDGSTDGVFGSISFDGTKFTTAALATHVAAHGISYDPFTHDMFINSGDTIQQIDASGHIIATVVVPGEIFDQGSEDGKGHLFVASNTGDLEFIDYAATGNIGSATFSTHEFLANSLDDIAPLSGPGAPEPGSLILFGTSILGAGTVLRRRLR